MDVRPIGIFDSGLGGLTGVRALERLLPGEDLIYFGDSANAPYGTRSVEELRRLALANAAFLNRFDVKAVLVACGTVSSNAMEPLRERFDFPFFSVLEPPCREAAAVTETGRVAVAATDATIRSGAFDRCLRTLDPEGRLQVFSKSCQSLVRTVEAGHFRPGDPVAERAVAEELAAIRDFGPDTVILACTHFPLLEDVIRAYLGPKVGLISVGASAAAALAEDLAARDALNTKEQGTRRFFTSGDPEEFSRLAEMFLGHQITVNHV